MISSGPHGPDTPAQPLEACAATVPGPGDWRPTLDSWQMLDFDGDGSLGLADAWGWLVQTFMAPGDAIVGFIVNRLPVLAALLELGPDPSGGPLAASLAAGVWLAALIAVGAVLQAVRDFDRFATAYLTGRWAALQRVLRVQRRRIVSWIGLLRHRHRERHPSLDVDAVTLEKLEAVVLRIHARVDEHSVLSIDDVAASLKLPARTVEAVLRRLRELCLLERGFGTDEGAEGHRITKLGQMYLIEH